mmetsp:Transcript_15973/g.28668  ORF Transcript_15973/g.28668 Transcript_15973/m.28668 type:complete len:225 (-) Transcript_15973:1146-1820(-)
MWHTAVPPEIQVRLIGLEFHPDGLDLAFQGLEVVLALGSANQLADLGNEHVHGSDGFSVGVQLHVEGLDILGVIVDDGGHLEDLLGEVPLVLGLEVDSPFDLVLEFGLSLLDGCLKAFDGLSVAAADEGVRGDLFQSGDAGRVDHLLDEIEVGAAGGEEVFAAVADVVFGALHIVLKVAEGDFGLDHPELGQVTRRVAVLGAESGPEGVDAGERAGVVLALELA